jgi:hypothetical protein
MLWSGQCLVGDGKTLEDKAEGKCFVSDRKMLPRGSSIILLEYRKMSYTVHINNG